MPQQGKDDDFNNSLSFSLGYKQQAAAAKRKSWRYFTIISQVINPPLIMQRRTLLIEWNH